MIKRVCNDGSEQCDTSHIVNQQKAFGWRLLRVPQEARPAVIGAYLQRWSELHMHPHVHAPPQTECSRWSRKRLTRHFSVVSTCTTLTHMLLLRRDDFSSYTDEPKPLLEEQSCFFWVGLF